MLVSYQCFIDRFALEGKHLQILKGIGPIYRHDTYKHVQAGNLWTQFMTWMFLLSDTVSFRLVFLSILPQSSQRITQLITFPQQSTAHPLSHHDMERQLTELNNFNNHCQLFTMYISMVEIYWLKNQYSFLSISETLLGEVDVPCTLYSLLPSICLCSLLFTKFHCSFFISLAMYQGASGSARVKWPVEREMYCYMENWTIVTQCSCIVLSKVKHILIFANPVQKFCIFRPQDLQKCFSKPHYIVYA